MAEETQPEEIIDPMQELPPKDWEELEMRYEREMEAVIQHEQSVMEEIEWVMKACAVGTPSVRDWLC